MSIRDKLEFETDDHGDMVGDNGIPLFCHNENCDIPASRRVVVSVRFVSDDTRNLCESCYRAYYMGVQHGRSFEAALFNKKSDLYDSQDEPFGGDHAPNCPYRHKGECNCWRSNSSICEEVYSDQRT